MLPEGWKSSTIGQHIELLSGHAFKSEEYVSSPDGIKLLRGDNVSQGRLRWRDVKRYPQSKAAGLDRYQLQVGDFVIAMDRTWIPAGVKVSEVFADDLPCLLVQRVARLRATPSLRQDLLRQYFAGHRFEQYVQGVQTETAVPHISPNDIKAFEILLPPLPEQRKIAEILSTWDAAISAQERLIDNARAQKKALMQTLLPIGSQPPKKRLPGFSGEWVSTKLENVAQVIVSNVDKKSGDGEQPVRLCNYMDVYRADRIEADMPFMRATAATAQIRKFGLRVSDVLITKDSETPDDIAVPSYVASTAADLVCGYHLAIIRAKAETDGQFLKYYFEQPTTQHFFASRANGATRFGLTIGAIESAPITLPSLPEQRCIGEAIAVAELEIERLLPIAEAFRREKSALMQQLLTGKRRVKLEEAVA